MTLAGLTQKDFIFLLKENGYDLVSNEYWDVEHVERVIYGKGLETIILRLKRYYIYPKL